MPPPTHLAAEADPNELASRALQALGAQREMPTLSADRGWSPFGLFSGPHGWIADAFCLAVVLLCFALIVIAVLRAIARRDASWQPSVAVAARPLGAASPHPRRAWRHARALLDQP
jgi:hypothetical protein